MISPLCTDDELVSASRYLQSPVARILAERLEVRARQMKQARAILTAPPDPPAAILAALDALAT